MEEINKNCREDVQELVKKLEEYDVVSFDIFDTLILRPFKLPIDVFRVLGIKHNIINFLETRRKAEKNARENAKSMYGHTEITIYDIYKEINMMTDLDIEEGVQAEFQAELDFCYANPYMKKVFDTLKQNGKDIIIVSDMYLPHDMMKKLLEKCGYTGESKLYVSCDYGMTKRNGFLYKYVKDDYIGDKNVIHIGDNKVSDIQSAQKNGINTYYYKKNDDIGSQISSVDMSPTIGSVYKGIISNFSNNGVNAEKMENVYYKYGFMYSGILIYGYVNWIHKYAIDNKLDKLLFLSRDGYILKKVYDMLYNDVPSEYCFWSRHAALKTIPERDLYRYIWQFIDRVAKNNDELTIKEVLDDLQLNFLENEFHIRNINLETKLDSKLLKLLRGFIIENKEKIISNSKMYNEAAKVYYADKVKDSKKVGVVDLGWRGSGAINLKDLFENYWNFDCEVKSLIAYGISRKVGFDDVFVLSEETNTYAFSEYENYEYSKKFQKKLLINMSLIEILISSAPKPSFFNFEFDENGNVITKFDREEIENYDIIEKLHEGVIDFVLEYRQCTGGYEFLQSIPSRDATSPIMSLLDDKKYEKFAKDFENFYYTYLVAGTQQTKLVSFYDVYKDEVKKLKEAEKKKKEQEQKKQIKKKKVKTITRVIKRIEKVLKNKETKIRYYYAKCYEKKKILENVVIVQSYAGDNFSGNPYYMLEELSNKKKYGDLVLYVAVKSENIKKTRKFLKNKGLNNVKLVGINTRKYARLLAQAKYLINNVAFPLYFIKKEGQVYINTWHGTPLKGLGKKITDEPHESGNYQRNFLMTDYFIQPNKYTYECMMRDYMIKNLYKGETIISGYPRNSIFYNTEEREKIRKKFGLEGKKVLVYMPTWRRDLTRKKKNNQYDKIESLLRVLNDRLDENTVVYVKLHNLVKDEINIEHLEKIKAFPEEYETYEFLNVADCLITDYSSVFFDFANTGKKIILYAYDKEEYMNGRSVYFPLEELPFPIVETEEGLLKELEKIEISKSYDIVKNEFCYCDNANATRKLCEYIFLQKKENYVPIKENVANDNILLYVGNLANTYKRKWIFDALKYIDVSDKNIFVNFYKLRVEKNKFFINEFSDRYNYLSIRGEKVITITEGIAYVLYYRFGVKSKYLEKKINDIYVREVKRLYPNIKFSKVIDMIGNSVEIMNLYSNIDAETKEIFIINNNIYKLDKRKKYKNEIIRKIDKFDNVYVEDGIIEDANANGCKLKLAKQEKDSLFQNKDNIVEKEIKEII